MFNVTPNSKPLRFGFGGSSRLSIDTARLTIPSGDSDWNSVALGCWTKKSKLTRWMYSFCRTPIAFRYLWQIWFVETDLGPIALGLPWKQKPDVGGRVSAMFGFASPKISKVQPWAGLRFSTDYLPSLGIDNGLVLRTGFGSGLTIDRQSRPSLSHCFADEYVSRPFALDDMPSDKFATFTAQGCLLKLYSVTS